MVQNNSPRVWGEGGGGVTAPPSAATEVEKTALLTWPPIHTGLLWKLQICTIDQSSFARD